MKKFKFKLETLLKVTSKKKKDAEIRFAEITQILAEQRKRLEELLIEMQQGRKNYETLTKGKKLTVGTLMTYNSFFAWKREQIAMQQEAILHSKAERQKRLKELLELVKKVKSIEQLKTRRLENYIKEMLDEEQKTLDEVGLNMYVRKEG